MALVVAVIVVAARALGAPANISSVQARAKTGVHAQFFRGQFCGMILSQLGFRLESFILLSCGAGG